MTNKEFSKYQEQKKKEYLERFGHYFLYEVKNDIKVLSPEDVKQVPKTDMVFQEEEKSTKYPGLRIVLVLIAFFLGLIMGGWIR